MRSLSLKTFEEELIEARESGFLSRLYKHNLISHTPMYYLDIYMDKKLKGLSNVELARRLGVTRQTIHRAIKSISE